MAGCMLCTASQATETRFKTKDGWTIVGDVYAPAGSAKSAVVLLHQRGGRASDWKPLCLALQKAGIEAIAIDQRGAGRSTHGPGPTGTEAPWPTGGDIDAVLATLPGKRVGLAGASYGANNALIYAAGHGQAVAAAALFSPGSNYHSLNALAAALRYGGPLLIFHAKNDSIAGYGPRQIVAAKPGGKITRTLRLLDGGGHGTALLSGTTVAETVRFFQQKLSPMPGASHMPGTSHRALAVPSSG